MPYPINQRAHQFNSIQSVPVSFGLWDTALKFLSPGPRSDVTDHLGTLVNGPVLLPRTDFSVTEGPAEIKPTFSVFEHFLYNSYFLFLKTHRANYVSVSFLSDIEFKVLITIQVNMFLLDREIYG